ncbi:MAG: histidine--tRNA ligase [Hyphomicrobiaceae bacterium]
MSKKSKSNRPEARLPKGFRDVGPEEARALERMLQTIREVYDVYGFEPLATSSIEYTDALGKFLPDQDRPNAGVFSFLDEDNAWLSLRYDLTAPLARYVAQNYDQLAKPYRRYQTGTVWRNEKPGPGRFREFVQFDADTVGAESPAADAEFCMLAADVMEKLGIPRGSYRMRVNNRKLIDGVLERAGIDPVAESSLARRLVVLRAIDKIDRLGSAGVEQLLGAGRKDESGDFTEGAKLEPAQIRQILDYVGTPAAGRTETLMALRPLVAGSASGEKGFEELQAMDDLLAASGFEADRVVIDPGVVRGLEYYTGPVFEMELTFEAKDETGETQRFGSVGGGGRYDGLVARFKGTTIPATGFSIGVSRLYQALNALGRSGAERSLGPAVILILDQSRLGDYQQMAQELRAAGIRAEIYLGSSGMKAQMRYADKRGAPLVVIQGDDERQRGEVTIKDLIEGAKLAGEIEDREAWREGRPAQFAAPRTELVTAVTRVLKRYAS